MLPKIGQQQQNMIYAKLYEKNTTISFRHFFDEDICIIMF